MYISVYVPSNQKDIKTTLRIRRSHHRKIKSTLHRESIRNILRSSVIHTINTLFIFILLNLLFQVLLMTIINLKLFHKSSIQINSQYIIPYYIIIFLRNPFQNIMRLRMSSPKSFISIPIRTTNSRLK